MDERRSSYRQQHDLEAIEVSLVLPEGDSLRVALLDLSSRGAAVAVTGLGEGGGYAVGASAHVEFRMPGLEPVAGIRVVIRNVRGEGSARIFGLEILDWQALHAALPPRLFAIFSRRRHYRVDVPRSMPIEALVSAGAGREAISAELVNVSVGGCQVQFPAAGNPSVGEAVSLVFTLPEATDELALSGVVRSVIGDSSGARCGIEFEALESRQEQALAQYIMQRQRESLTGD